MKTRTEKFVGVAEWDALVTSTYGRPYSFQQQSGCRDRGSFALTVPPTATYEDEQNDTVPEVVNHNEMGVKFSSWLSRDPQQPLVDCDQVRKAKWEIDMWWERNFYPDIHTVANDLHQKGLLEAGEYIILIDW